MYLHVQACDPAQLAASLLQSPAQLAVICSALVQAFAMQYAGGAMLLTATGGAAYSMGPQLALQSSAQAGPSDEEHLGNPKEASDGSEGLFDGSGMEEGAQPSMPSLPFGGGVGGEGVWVCERGGGISLKVLFVMVQFWMFVWTHFDAL